MRALRARYPRTSAFVAARLTPGAYLGLHLTVGFLLSVVALVVFGVIAADVLDRDELALFDAAVVNGLRDRVTAEGRALFRIVSILGGARALVALGLTVAVILVLARKRTLVQGWVAALAGGELLDWGLKAVFRRPRPEAVAAQYLPDQGLPGHSWSFPSGHALMSLIAYGMLAYLAVLFVRSPHRRAILIAAATVLILAIGFSRLYLGVHYFTDVVGGYAVGAVWLSACVSGLEVARRR